MIFSIDNPAILFILIPAILLVLLSLRKVHNMAVWRKRIIGSLRIALLILLILCLAGPGLRKVSNSTTTIFLLDGSDSSTANRGAVEGFISEALKHRKPSEKVGVITFGNDASVESVPSAKPYFAGIQTIVDGSFTDMEEALRMSSSLIPSGDRKRVVLVSDGLENTGDALKQARIMHQMDVTIDTYHILSQPENEVQVKSVTIPETLRLNEHFEIAASVNSTVQTKAVLRLYSDRAPVGERQVDIQKGENNFVFSGTASRGGMLTYTVEIDPNTDTITANNRMSAFSMVQDSARLLVIQDEDEAASEIVAMLGNEMDLTVIRPDDAPVTMDEMLKYDAFIISNVSAERLRDSFLGNLETVIKSQGKGLLVTGGENSFAPGGYYKTPLETILPVNMDIKPKEEQPNLGLILVIDKSGSMSDGQYGVSRLDLAKEAAIRSTEVLKSDDMIGVLGFDGAAQWVVKPQKLTNLKKVQDAIGTLRPSGGTAILRPLQEAYEALRELDTKLKHIILLTDGQAEKAGYEPIIEAMKKDGITLSTVAVGQQADSQLLRYLAEGGKGRFYATDEFTDIPKIFAKETFLAGKTYLNNRTFTPALKSYSEILKGIDAIPSLDGYVGTTAKNAARVVFASDQEDPVFATWQYGLGRTAAWTSDTKGMWTSRWLQWDQSARFWKNTLSWLVQKRMEEGYSISGGLEAGMGTIQLDIPADQSAKSSEVTATVIDPSGTEQKVRLEPTKPGSYSGSFKPGETGVYVTSVKLQNSDGTEKNITSGIAIPYSPEYDISTVDSAAFMERLAYTGGGRVLADAEEVFKNELPPVVSITDITPFLLTLAIFVFLADIAMRRLNINFNKAAAAVVSVAGTSAQALKRVSEPVGRSFARMTASNKGRRKAIKPKSEINESKESLVQNSTPPASSDAHISALLEMKKKRER